MLWIKLIYMLVLSSVLPIADTIAPKVLIRKPRLDQKKTSKIQSWLQNDCRPFRRLINQKGLAIKRIEQLVQNVHMNKKISKVERHVQLDTFKVFSQELNETEDEIVYSLAWMSDVLQGDYSNLPSLIEKSKLRLESLRDATLREEREYQSIVKAEEQLRQFNHSKIQGVINDILVDVAKAADQLENKLDDHVFDQALLDPHLANGANIKAVIQLEDEDDFASLNLTDHEHLGGAGVIKLVDAQDNQFVLAKGQDSTVPHEDRHFIQDLIHLMLISFVCGWVCTLAGLPSMFGYIIGGVIIGPSGLNILKSLVQIETLGEFGAFFILFTVGLEFSPAQLKKVLKIALLGTSLISLFMVIIGLVVGTMLEASANEAAFLAACLSLSSTPLVVKFLNPGSEQSEDNTSDSLPGLVKKGPSNTDYGAVLLGMLIMQDVFLGLLMAVLPNMATPSGKTTPSPTDATTAVSYILLIVKLSSAILLMLVICYFLSKFIIPRFYLVLSKKGNKEMTLLGTVLLAFIMLMLTDKLEISMELGCFMAGALVSAQGHDLSHHVETLISPLRDFLSCIFFASIGLHVFPQFLAYELTILVTFTLAIVGAKYLISVLVLSTLVPKSSWHLKWIVSAGLAQVSEFSFVLGSRARRLGLISREVYLLILSVTTLSLLFAPVLWRSTLWQLRVRTQPQTHASIHQA